MKKFLWITALLAAAAFVSTVVGCDDGSKGGSGGDDDTTIPIQLTADNWADGNIAASNGEQWFKFTASNATEYIYVNFGTLTDLYVQLYDSGGKNAIEDEANLHEDAKSVTYTSLTAGQEYYIIVLTAVMPINTSIVP